jgi:hypothetical protein
MKLTKLATVLALGLAAAGAQPALADGPDDRALYEMLMRSEKMRTTGTVTKSDFMKMMEKRFDAMDKGRRGALTAEEIKRLLDAAAPL